MASGKPGEVAPHKRRRVVYLIVPRDLAAKLHGLLRRHFERDALVEVVVERRASNRRGSGERRAPDAGAAAGSAPAEAAERRRIRAAEGRRAGDRRAGLLPVDAPPLPGRARRFAERLVFVERAEPSTQHLEDLDTARIVSRVQAGDKEAFVEIYMRYFDRVYAYLRVALKDSHEAEDVAQQVFMRVLEKIALYERRAQPFRAWLFAIVRNNAVDELKKRERISVRDSVDIDRTRESSAVEEAHAQVLEWLTDRELVMFIDRLPLPQRQVLVLRYMMDLPYRQIAEVLDLSPEHVKVLNYRALEFLRERLGAVGRGAGSSGKREPIRRFLPAANVLRARRWALSP